MGRCYFLDRLPIELRLRIYEHLLTFDEPIKLRQVIKGSRNLSVLRLNRQIHQETLGTLYDLNTIVVTRNDFCTYTDSNIKTPLKFDYARHLFVTSFSQSIACTPTGPDYRCEVCQPDAMGLVKSFTKMPRLQTVLVDYHRHLSEMRVFRDRLVKDGIFELVPISTGFGSYAYKLEGPGIEGLDIQFKCGRMG